MTPGLGSTGLGALWPHHQMWCSWQRPRPVDLNVLRALTPVIVCPSAQGHLGCWHECPHSAQPPRKHTDARQLGQRSDGGDFRVKVTVLWAFSCFTVSNAWRGEIQPELPTRKDPDPHPLCAPSQGCQPFSSDQQSSEAVHLLGQPYRTHSPNLTPAQGLVCSPFQSARGAEMVKTARCKNVSNNYF